MELEEIKKQIEEAREHAKKVFVQRGNLALILTKGFSTGYEVEFPDVDMMHVYGIVVGRRMSSPAIYRLSFGKKLKWVGISSPLGKPADIIC